MTATIARTRRDPSLTRRPRRRRWWRRRAPSRRSRLPSRDRLDDRDAVARRERHVGRLQVARVHLVEETQYVRPETPALLAEVMPEWGHEPVRLLQRPGERLRTQGHRRRPRDGAEHLRQQQRHVRHGGHTTVALTE